MANLIIVKGTQSENGDVLDRMIEKYWDDYESVATENMIRNPIKFWNWVEVKFNCVISDDFGTVTFESDADYMIFVLKEL